MEYLTPRFALTDLSRVNVVLGKNGCGKSSMLTYLESTISGENIGQRRYITPERGGTLLYEPSVENTMSSNPTWLQDTRRVNQFGQFKQQTAAEYRRLEQLVHRAAEKENRVSDFQEYVDSINSLLDNIEIRRETATFRPYRRGTETPIPLHQISSGESELITLAIELLVFKITREKGKDNVLLLDEPDVHLHPDLQYRLMSFLRDMEGYAKLLVKKYSPIAAPKEERNVLSGLR